jgi:hypothetical protein
VLRHHSPGTGGHPVSAFSQCEIRLGRSTVQSSSCRKTSLYYFYQYIHLILTLPERSLQNSCHKSAMATSAVRRLATAGASMMAAKGSVGSGDPISALSWSELSALVADRPAPDYQNGFVFRSISNTTPLFLAPSPSYTTPHVFSPHSYHCCVTIELAR